MEDNDVLDDLENLEPEVPEHRQRCFRFLWYSLGLALVMAGQVGLASSGGEGAYSTALVKLGPLFSLGVVGVWLFAGLGSLAAIRAIKQQRPDVLLGVAFILHLLALALSTCYLYRVVFTVG